MDHFEDEELENNEEFLNDAIDEGINDLPSSNGAEDAEPSPNPEEPVPEEPASSRKTIISGAIQNAKAQASKKILALLIKNPYFWIVVGVILFLLLIAILVFQLDFDLVGIGKPNPTYYAELPSCGQVYYTWEDPKYTDKRYEEVRLGSRESYEKVSVAAEVDLEETDPYDDSLKRYVYEEYSYNDFITGIVWYDNYEAKDVENETVYEALGVAARSKLVAHLVKGDNCVVLKEFDEQGITFSKYEEEKENKGDLEKYSDISNAIKDTKGLIIGRNEEIISADYDIFTYFKKRKDNEEEYADTYFYHLINRNEEKHQVVLAKWVDELEKEKGIPIPKQKTPTENESETLYLKSLSMYGAKYLLETIDSGKQYNLHRILETYYGRDIEYYTIDPNADDDYPNNCSDISMTSTTLTREEFIALVEKNGKNKNEGAKALADNAGLIYDLSVSNGVNPELVIIRADIEGYSPGGSTYNYWGYGCTNKKHAKDCKQYNSFSEGLLAFLKFVSKYETLTDLMAVYAYLGDYWYNPGSSLLSGCYYMTPMYGNNPPERVKNACASDKSCTSEGHGDCVPTTKEEQRDYQKYQSQSMLAARKKIFGLDADICVPDYEPGEPGIGNCTIWKQGDPRWASIPLGNSKTNMKRSGCAVTSVAIAMSCSGVTINGVTSFNPGTLVNALNRNSGFTKSGGIYWANRAITLFAPSFRYVSTNNLSGSDEEKVNQIKKTQSSNKIIILHFKNSEHPRGHYVVLKSVSSSTFTVYDPAPGSINTYKVSDADQFVLYTY